MRRTTVLVTTAALAGILVSSAEAQRAWTPSQDAGLRAAGGQRGLLRAPAGEGLLAAPAASDASRGLLLGASAPGPAKGLLAAPAPAGTRFGDPTPAERIRALDAMAEIYLTDTAYANAEPYLRESARTREESLGAAHPEVAPALDRHADVLRKLGRDGEASEVEARSQEIRRAP